MVKEPVLLFQVIVQVPSLTAVIIPFELTFAIFSSEVLHFAEVQSFPFSIAPSEMLSPAESVSFIEFVSTESFFFSLSDSGERIDRLYLP